MPKQTIKSRQKNLGQYRSGLEKTFAKEAPRGYFEYEPYALEYKVHRRYTPDFVVGDTLIECKGFFRAGDTQKYKAIRDYYPDKELIFVLSDPNKKVRKGGKATMGEWCQKEGFAFFTVMQMEALIAYVENA